MPRPRRPRSLPRRTGQRHAGSPAATLKSRPRPADTGCMSHDLLNRIDQRTRLAGHNRLALLLFRLGGRQLFGVNVFKVQEVLRRPPLFLVPGLPTPAGARCAPVPLMRFCA